MKRLIVILCAVSLFLHAPSASIAAGAAPAREGLFLIEEKITFRGLPEEAAALRVWIPYPHSDDLQDVRDLKLETSFEADFVTEKEYGNKVIYLKPREPASGHPSEIRLSFLVRRRESAAQAASPAANEDVSRFLKPDSSVPVGGEMAALARKITRGAAGDLEKARAIYDYLISELTYARDDPAVCGVGDSLVTLAHKKGMCSDYHSLFISLARSLGIPAKFEIGFPVPAGMPEGRIAGYHCWAKFYIPGKGWIPVDISEADKHPERKDYFFGHIDENRVRVTSGRDIRLEYAAGAGALNFFVYPYAEVNGRQFEDMEVEIYFKKF